MTVRQIKGTMRPPLIRYLHPSLCSCAVSFAIGRKGAPPVMGRRGQLKENAEKGGRFLCCSPDF